jgi:hypothetical protein
MLQYLKNSEIANPDITIIRGCDISGGKFSKRQRGQLAIEVIDGRAIITDLNKKQLARVFGLPARYFRALLDGSHHRDDLLDTELKLDSCRKP